MGVIKSLEKIYVLKIVGIPEYYLGGNVEILGDAWNNQGLGLKFLSRHTFRTSFLSLKVFLIRS
jgi:hypothetical protein